MIEPGKEMVVWQPPIREGRVERISRKKAPPHYNFQCVLDLDYAELELRTLAYLMRKSK